MCKPEGKLARKPFNEAGTRATQLLQLVHSDMCGPFSVRSLSGARFFITFVDDFSRKVFIYPLKTKGQAFEKFVDFKKRVENELEKTIKTFRSDNGTEYINNSFKQYIKKNGIQHQNSAPYSPQQNGVAERMNRTLIEKVRYMLLDAKMSKQFWAEAVQAAANITNALPNATNGIAPDEMWNKKSTNINNFYVFGCKAMVWQPEKKRKRLDAKSYPCIFMRYADDAKAYRLYDTSARKIVISIAVVFMEDENMTIDSNNSFENASNFVSDDDDSGELFEQNSVENEAIASRENQQQNVESTASDIADDRQILHEDESNTVDGNNNQNVSQNENNADQNDDQSIMT